MLLFFPEPLLNSPHLSLPCAPPQADLLREDINGILFTLPSLERAVLALRYGLGGGGGAVVAKGARTEAVGDQRLLSLSAVAKQLGLSVERVRQVQERALAKLRVPWRQRYFLQEHMLRGVEL